MRNHVGGRGILDNALMAAYCKPNISAAGRKRRVIVGWVGAGLTALGLGAAVVLHVPWYLRALVALPALASASGFIQASRNTCMMRAADGTFEHDDFTATPAPADEVEASRKVSREIKRDVVLVGLAVGLLAAATAWVA